MLWLSRGQGSPGPCRWSYRPGSLFYLRYQRQSGQLDKLCRRLLIGKPVGANLGDQTDLRRSTNPIPSAGLFSLRVLPGAQGAKRVEKEHLKQRNKQVPTRRRPRVESVAQTARRLRAVAGLPPHREPLGPRTNPAPALSLRRGSAGRHSGWRARPRISAQAVVVSLAKMSAKPAVGFVNEASRQILAGGSAGKAAPPGASRFSLCVFRKRFSDKCPHRSFAIFLCLPRSRGRACRARARGAREQRRPGAGGGRRVSGVPGQVATAPALATLGFPHLLCS